MIYLLIFYWIFAALFCFGAIYRIAKSKSKSIFGAFVGCLIFGAFVGCLIFGGILFPMYLDINLKFEDYE